MKRILVAGGLLLCLALLGTPARAQTGSARGRVSNEQGQPIVEAKVEIDFTGGLTRKYKTTATKEGFQGSFIEVRISLGDPTEVPEFRLKTLAAGQKAAGGGGQGGQ